MAETVKKIRRVSQLNETIPMVDMMNYLKEANPIPYASSLSFTPYVKSLKSKISNSCDHTKSALLPVLEEYSNFIDSGQYSLEQLRHSKEVDAVTKIMVPTMFFEKSMSFVSMPFKQDFLFTTIMFEEKMSNSDMEFVVKPDHVAKVVKSNRIEAHILILNQLYGQNLPQLNNEHLIIRNKKTKVVKYYHIDINIDFVEVLHHREIPKLSQKDVNYLVNHIDDFDYWDQLFPADMFTFNGFVTGQLIDVTETEALSELKIVLSEPGKTLNPTEVFSHAESYVRSFMDDPTITFGKYSVMRKTIGNWRNLSLTGFSDKKLTKNLSILETEIDDVYLRVLKSKQVQFEQTLQKTKKENIGEQRLIENGFNSLLLYPVADEHNNLISIVEIASKNAAAFNQLIVDRLRGFFDLLEESYEVMMEETHYKVSKVIKEKFTSIHESVEWKFEEVALKHLENQTEMEDAKINEIVFKDLVPLYGQLDIVGSSSIRNKAIKADLLKNLDLLIGLMLGWQDRKKLFLLEKYIIKLKRLSDRISKRFISSDETSIVNIITNEVHPFLEQLTNRHKEFDSTTLQSYLDQLDPVQHIIYKDRKSFEESVNFLNVGISKYLEHEDDEMQTLLPHYFEKYKTDGVEYNIYLGESLLQSGPFDSNDIKEFKIWQLVNMTKLVKYVHELSPTLSTPLDTAQLIFVYNHPFSIRFRMDEKRFDVDGAYNVRYEILKKRIDKSIIKGTKERLTVKNKIAIVYLSEADKLEYLEYLDYMREKGLIEDQIEDLELEKMQGAEGLKALRVTVKF